MASLSGNSIASTYDGLLKFDDNNGVTTSPKTVTDGTGNSTALSLSDSEIAVAGNLTVNGNTTITGSTEIGANLTVTGNAAVAGNLTVTGEMLGTAATASYVTSSNVVGIITSASYAITASYAENAGTTVDTGSLVTTSSFVVFTGSYDTFVEDYNTWTGSASSVFAGTAATASYVDLIAGEGIIVNGKQVTATVRSVNGVFPSVVTGDVATSLLATKVGTSASLAESSSGAITGSIPSGLVWVIANDEENYTKNGQAYIYVSSSVGSWNRLTGIDTEVQDSLYLAVGGFNAMQSTLDMNENSIINVGDVIPYTDPGELTSSYSLGSPTAAWKDLYVSNASIRMISNTGGPSVTLQGSADGLLLDGNIVVSRNLFGENGTVYTGNPGVKIGVPPGPAATNNYFNANLRVGGYAMSASDNVITGDLNTAIGHFSLYSLTQGSNNTALGYKTLYNCAVYSGNTAVGAYASNFIGGDNNTTVGYRAGYSTYGAGNVAVGNQALSSNVQTTKSYNTAVGTDTLKDLRSGSYNISVGTKAGENLRSGSYNVYIGPNAGPSSAVVQSNQLYIGTTSGENSLIRGDFNNRWITLNAATTSISGSLSVTQSLNVKGNAVVSGSLHTSGSTVISGSLTVRGLVSLQNLTTAVTPYVLGYNPTTKTVHAVLTSSLSANTGPITNNGTGLYSTTPTAGISPANSIFFGQSAGLNAISATSTIMLGYGAGQTAVNASEAVIIGTGAGSGATNAAGTVFVGYAAGSGATEANSSVFIGVAAGNGASGSYKSNFIGYGAGEYAENAYYANIIGDYAGYNAVSGQRSNMIGRFAGMDSDVTISNLIGPNAGNAAVEASNVNFFGDAAGGDSRQASYSNFIGTIAGNSSTGSSNSSFIGTGAGYKTVNASKSIMIGHYAGSGSIGSSNSIFIGEKAGAIVNNTSPGSNTIIIGNALTVPGGASNAINIGGIIFATGSYAGSSVTSNPVANGKVGIGTNNPSTTLHVSGSMTVTSTVVLTGLLDANYANDDEAESANIPIGGLYRNGNVVSIRVS